MTDVRDNSASAKKRRVKIHETTHENDIRYLGPLTYQHFKLFGWLCIVVSQIAVIVRMGGRIDAGFAGSSALWLKVLDNAADLALPFLLIANFAQILRAEDGYKRPLIVNGAATLGICGLYYLLFYRYMVGNVARLLEDPSEALPLVQSAISAASPYGFIAFNLFLDLFLCTLTMIFLNYRPRRVFTGKWCILFRLLALLPVAYEVGCMLLKVRAVRGQVAIPAWAYPLLTMKPPMTFVLFVALALFVKTREMRFRRHGKTHEEYRAFLKTRRNSWNFSVFLAVMLVVVSVIDFAVVLGFSLDSTANSINAVLEKSAQEQASANAQAVPEGVEAMPPVDGQALSEGDAAKAEAPKAALREEQISAFLDSGMRKAEAVGFGGSINLILLAPLVLLFSYTRKPKYGTLDIAIPVAGMALIVLVYLEGSHQLLGLLPIQKVNVQEMRDTADLYFNLLMMGTTP